jgi:hypothetical protein
LKVENDVVKQQIHHVKYPPFRKTARSGRNTYEPNL